MALSDKNIVITPNIGQTADPKIVFSGADGSTGANNITLTAYPTNSGTLSFDGSAGQLFSITNNLTGTLFSVNDISGIPSIEVIDTGLVRLTQYSGRVLLGTGTDNASDKLQVVGNIGATGSITASGLITAAAASITTGATGYVGATGSIGAPTGYFNNLFLNGTALSTSGGGTAFATTSLQVTGTNGATGATGSLTVSGDVMIGTTTPSTKLTVYDGATGAIVSTIGDGVGSNFRASRYSNDAIGANNAVIKYRGTFASPLAAASADSTGQFNFNAWGGTTIRTVARMAGFVDTYTSDTNISGYLTLSTSPSGSADPIERMRIDAAGGVNAANYLAVGTLTGATGATGAITATNNVGAGTITVGTGATGATGSITASGTISATSASITTGATGYVGATGSVGAPSGYFNNLFVNGTSVSGGGGGGTTFATTSLQVTGTNGATGATGSISAGHIVIGASSATAGYKLDLVGNFKVSGSIDENVFTITDGTVALSPQNGTIQTWTLGASRTPTAGTWEAGESMTLMINDSASSFTVTWTSLPVTWVGGAAPSLAPASGFTIIQLWKVGTTIYGALVGQVT